LGDLQEFAASKNMPYIETSAKESTNVEEAFLIITKSLIATRYGLRLFVLFRVSAFHCGPCDTVERTGHLGKTVRN
jgi:hypothetical protein